MVIETKYLDLETGQLVLASGEVIQYSGKSGNRLTGLTRGKSCVHTNCGVFS